MIQKLDKYGSTSVDNANVVILDKNGNVKKIAAASGTVTSILTASPITGGPITSSGTIGITQATTSTDGYLSSTDWNTFNSKFNLPSLTSGSVLFSNGTTIAQKNSNFFWDDVNNRLGVGTNAPTTTLHIKNPSGGQIAVFGNDSTNSRILIGYGAGGGHLLELGSFSGYSGIQNVVTNGKLVLQGTNGGNLLVGTTTDNGGKLQIKAPGALSTDIALKVRNSADTVDLMTLDGLGRINIKSNGFTGTMSLAQTANSTSVISGGPASENITFGPSNRIFLNASQVSVGVLIGTNTIIGSSISGSAGTSLNISSNSTFVASSGLTQTHLKITSSVGLQNIGPTFNALNIEPTINNITTSAAIVRGLYYNPILTSLTGTSHRAIETTTGDVLFNTTSGNVGINTTAPTAKLYVKAGGALSTDLAFRVRNSADTGDLMLVNGLGNVGIGKSPSYPLDIAITNAGNLLSGMYVTGIHSDGRSALYGVANTSTERLLYWWHNGGIAVGTGGSTKGGAVSYIGDRSYYGPAHSMYFMETVGGGFGPNNVKYRLGITTSTTNTSFESGVSNNLTNIESNTFTFTAKSHTFYTGTTAGNTSLPNQYIALHLSTTGEVGIGTITPTAKLHIKAPGALSTDIALRVRNSADTADLATIGGTGILNLTGNILIAKATPIISINNTSTTLMGIEYLNSGTVFAYNGIASSTNAGINGSIAGDFYVRANSRKIIFSTDSGTTTQLALATTGNLLIGTTTDIASSKLTIESTTQGFLPPRMTNAQRIAIATPAVGLCVYCTDVVEGLYINKSTGWTYIG